MNTNKNYVEYYWLRKELYTKSIQMKFGYGQLPQKFTEGICNELFKLNRVAKKEDYDSLDSNNNKIEIKATQMDGKSVSINKNADYKYLFWININYDENKVTIKKYNKEDVDSVIEGLPEDEKNKSRPTIKLDKIKNQILQETYIITKECFKKS
ncbi:MAG: hypothetical protein ACRCVJ_13190 [Clostridium sp.]|uniref:hypothetical protein n=1 Tax=Clostridium sp. TaxID=1506 RepID=UPI003F38C61D